MYVHRKTIFGYFIIWVIPWKANLDDNKSRYYVLVVVTRIPIIKGGKIQNLPRGHSNNWSWAIVNPMNNTAVARK